MKKKIQIPILLFSAFFFLSFVNHPIKLTSSLIKYDSSKKAINIECKVFIDDFAPAINETLEKKINSSKLTKDDISDIEKYFISNYKFFLNSKKLTLKLVDYRVKKNVMTISFSLNQVSLKKGDRLKIENELLFERFPDLQSNWMTIQMPPFIPNYSFESNFENYTYTRTF